MFTITTYLNSHIELRFMLRTMENKFALSFQTVGSYLEHCNSCFLRYQDEMMLGSVCLEVHLVPRDSWFGAGVRTQNYGFHHGDFDAEHVTFLWFVGIEGENPKRRSR